MVYRGDVQGRFGETVSYGTWKIGLFIEFCSEKLHRLCAQIMCKQRIKIRTS